MSVLQMQKAVKEGLVTKELIRQLAVMEQKECQEQDIHMIKFYIIITKELK